MVSFGVERMSCVHPVLPMVSGGVCTTALQAAMGSTWWSECSSDVPCGLLPTVGTVSIDVIPTVRVAPAGELELAQEQPHSSEGVLGPSTRSNLLH